MGLRKLRGAGSGWYNSLGGMLQWHWSWADVQVEGGAERDAGGGMRDGAIFEAPFSAMGCMRFDERTNVAMGVTRWW